MRGKSITEDHLDACIRNPDVRIQHLQTHEPPRPKLPTSPSLPAAMEELERRMIEDRSGKAEKKNGPGFRLELPELFKKLGRLWI